MLSLEHNVNYSIAEIHTVLDSVAVYAARICASRSTKRRCWVEDNLVNLSAGMVVTVEVKTGSRAVLTYLLSPLLRSKQESLRER